MAQTTPKMTSYSFFVDRESFYYHSTMLTVLNVALVVIATASTLAAFGGEAWDKGEGPLLARIKPRGWASLFLLLLAFGLGITKEVLTKLEEKLSKADETLQRTDLKARLDRSQNELASQKELLISQKKQLIIMSNSLDQSNARAIELHSYLASTQASLAQQSTVNLITALSDGKRRIAELWVMLPIKKTGPRDLDAQHLVLSGFNQHPCAEAETGGTLELGGANYYYLFPRVRAEFKNVTPSGIVIDGNQQSPTDFFKLVNQLADQRSSNKYVLAFRVRPNPSQARQPNVQYAFTLNPTASDFVSNMMITSSPLSLYIARDHCVSPPANLISKSFEKAVLILILDDAQQGQAIYYKLRAQPIRTSEHALNLDFRVDSLPNFVGFPAQRITIGPDQLVDHPR